MQSTGHTSTHELSLTPMHGSAITYTIRTLRQTDGHFSQRDWENYNDHRRFYKPRLCKTCAGHGSPRTPADALAQPTRARLFTLLTELRRPAGTEELADGLELHPNGVRVHLERLHDAGLVERASIAAAARTATRHVDDRARMPNRVARLRAATTSLGRWLARATRVGRTSARTVEATGREIGRELAPAGNSDPPEQRMHAVLAALGFQPQREPKPPAGMTYRLCNCPYRDAASESPEVVCGLHRGMTRGLLDVIAPTTKLTGFVPHDPYEAGCRIELTGGLETEGRTEERQPA